MTQLFKIGFGLSIASITMCLLVGILIGNS